MTGGHRITSITIAVTHSLFIVLNYKTAIYRGEQVIRVWPAFAKVNLSRRISMDT